MISIVNFIQVVQGLLRILRFRIGRMFRICVFSLKGKKFTRLYQYTTSRKVSFSVTADLRIVRFY